MEVTKNIGLRRLQLVGHVMRLKDYMILKNSLKGTYKRDDQLEGPAVNWDANRMLKCKDWRKSEDEADV
jgi:hypothetical protein